MSMSGIRSAIATALDAITGLSAGQYAPDVVPTVPYAYVINRRGEYHQTAGAGAPVTHTLEVYVLASRAADLKKAQEKIDEFLDASGDASVVQAIEGASYTTHADYAEVSGYEIRPVEIAGTTYLAVMFTVEVTT